MAPRDEDEKMIMDNPDSGLGEIERANKVFQNKQEKDGARRYQPRNYGADLAEQ